MDSISVKECDIAIIGGGASGLAAAIEASRTCPSLSVIILEKLQEVGAKVSASGNGKCNLSNMASPDWEKTSSFFSSLGLLTRSDSEGRIYPYSEDGRDVTDCLKREAEIRGVEILRRRQVTEVAYVGEGFQIKAVYNRPKAYRSKPGDGPIEIRAKKLLIATGGKSKPKLGTSGDGYTFAKAMGHTVNRLIPVLTGIETLQDIKSWGLSGVREKCVASLYKKGNMVYSDKGEIQFADYGISGIVIFDMTRFMDLEEDGSFDDFVIEVDFLPDFSEPYLEKIIEEGAERLGLSAEDMDCEEVQMARDYAQVIRSMVKKPLVEIVSNLAISNPDCSNLDGSETKGFNYDGFNSDGSGFDSNKEVTESMKHIIIKGLVYNLKHFTLNPKNLRGWDMAQVTRGGIPLEEIDYETGESNIVPGLFFAGEILDEDFRCGGFNLQHAWTTGLKAGRAMAR